LDAALLSKVTESVSALGIMALMLHYFVNRCDSLYIEYQKICEDRFKEIKEELAKCHDGRRALEQRFLKGGH
jgi:hypothetical protein